MRKFLNGLFATSAQLVGSSTVGQVWTATDTSGNGAWQSPSGGSGTLTDTNTSQQGQARREGWAFPDGTINAATDIAAKRFFSVKPIWYEVNSSGALVSRNSSSFGANFYYTAANALTVRQNSSEQYVCVSLANATWMDTLCSSAANRASAISTLKQFCIDNDFTGVELDWEAFASWTSTQYANYKTFVTELGNALHAAGFRLMIDCPPIWNNSTTVTSNEWTNRNSQGYYLFKYEDFDNLPVDYLCVMAYDYHFDMGAGYPTAPLAWQADIYRWIKSKITNKKRIVAGIPSAGYYGATGGFTITGATYAFLSTQTGFGGATRDSGSQELNWTNGGNSYFILDDTAVNAKIKQAEALGIDRVSLWHIGDNKYDNTRMQHIGPIPAPAQFSPPPRRVTTLVASSNTYTPNTDTTDIALITTPAANFTVADPSGTLSDGQRLLIRIKQGASAFTITWGTSYRSSGIATLPTAGVASKTVTLGFMYDASAAKLVLLALDNTGY